MATLEGLLVVHLPGPVGTPHGSGHVSLCKAAVCNRHLQSEWKQLVCFCILADSRAGTDGIFSVGLHTSHAAFGLI